ncbi:MAG TPA: response regulator [Thermoanaerobaculia bacterium]
MATAHILIVDDDENSCRTCAAALVLEGYEVRVSTVPQEALEQLAIEPPDAILLDFKMPYINGVGFLYRVRANPTLQHIPVALITGAVLDDLTSGELRELGADVWFKPVWLEDVVEITRGLLAKGAGAPITE